jgi:hypothetical protein
LLLPTPALTQSFETAADSIVLEFAFDNFNKPSLALWTIDGARSFGRSTVSRAETITARGIHQTWARIALVHMPSLLYPRASKYSCA